MKVGPEVVATVPMVRTGGPVPSRSWVGKTGNFVSKATVSLASRCGNKAVHDELASRCLKKRRGKRLFFPSGKGRRKGKEEREGGNFVSSFPLFVSS
jgi:hypothetical protein